MTESTSSKFLIVKLEAKLASDYWIPKDKSASLKANRSLAPSPHIPTLGRSRLNTFSHKD